MLYEIIIRTRVNVQKEILVLQIDYGLFWEAQKHEIQETIVQTLFKRSDVMQDELAELRDNDL